MLKRFLIALAMLLAVVAVIFYYKLGGNQPLTFDLVSHSGFYVTGRFFEGKIHDPTLENLFFEAKVRSEKNSAAILTVVNYQNKRKNRAIRQFLGAGTRTGPPPVPEPLEVRTYPPHKAVVTTIKAHNFVMPTAEKVRHEAIKFAGAHGYVLDTLSYETYISDRELRISFPVKINVGQ